MSKPTMSFEEWFDSHYRGDPSWNKLTDFQRRAIEHESTVAWSAATKAASQELAQRDEIRKLGQAMYDAVAAFPKHAVTDELMKEWTKLVVATAQWDVRLQIMDCEAKAALHGSKGVE